MASFRPLQDRVLLKPLKSEARTKGGLFIPDVAQTPPPEAEVVAIGPGTTVKGKFNPVTDVQPGDIVVYLKTNATTIQIDGVDHLVAREEDLVGVVKKASPPEQA